MQFRMYKNAVSVEGTSILPPCHGKTICTMIGRMFGNQTYLTNSSILNFVPPGRGEAPCFSM